MHDGADEHCLTILKHLRAAAGPKTQQVIVDQIIPSVSEEPAVREIPRNLRSHPSTQVYLFDILVRNQKVELKL